MNPEPRPSRCFLLILVVGFNLGIGRILNEHFGLSGFAVSRIPTTQFAILLGLAALTIIVGLVQLTRRQHFKVDRVVVVISIGIVAAFAAFDPTMNIAPIMIQHSTYSQLACVITAIGFACGCVVAAEATHRGFNGIGIGCILFWLAVAWKFWANFEALQNFNEVFA